MPQIQSLQQQQAALSSTSTSSLSRTNSAGISIHNSACNSGPTSGQNSNSNSFYTPDQLRELERYQPGSLSSGSLPTRRTLNSAFSPGIGPARLSNQDLFSFEEGVEEEEGGLTAEDVALTAEDEYEFGEWLLKGYSEEQSKAMVKRAAAERRSKESKEAQIVSLKLQLFVGVHNVMRVLL